MTEMEVSRPEALLYGRLAPLVRQLGRCAADVERAKQAAEAVGSSDGWLAGVREALEAIERHTQDLYASVAVRATQVVAGERGPTEEPSRRLTAEALKEAYEQVRQTERFAHLYIGVALEESATLLLKELGETELRGLTGVSVESKLAPFGWRVGVPPARIEREDGDARQR